MLNLLLPVRCAICKKESKQPYALCKKCEASLPILENSCSICAINLPKDAPNNYCAECLKAHPYFDKTASLYRYEDEISNMISALKFKENLAIAKLFGRLFFNHIGNQELVLPDVIIPVPLHKKRLRQRGFNQALEIAKPIARQFKVRLLRNTCVRIRHTKPQSDLPKALRKQNIKHAFELRTSLDGLHVVIFDDVMTTGNTVNEISRCAKNAGAKQVDIWCVARAIRER